ncbi:NUDIX hydrolase [Donghicola sp.]|uniref:NUDIX hydrolase n=1 Tax=Donghicola sp. TaxID=1929294 RepID=UPI0025E6A5CA|nr:NUDIX hydrolase [Donghicola sp.]MCT4579707.1 NUDIX hydrolase [Donghicola sp.]
MNNKKGQDLNNGIAALLKSSFNDYVLPMMQRPSQLQTAALCYREAEGEKQVLLITSRGTGRWVIPKGWTMRGLNAGQAAVVEAWEEAGVRPHAEPDEPLGSFNYKKIKGSGLPVDVEVLVYPVRVTKLEDDFPEATQRKRAWVRPRDAANMVDEPGLQEILRDF